jgi:hypothetical protein
MRNVVPLLLPGLLLALPTGASAQEGAEAVVARAIQAHGGEDRLAQVHADRVGSEGTFYHGDKAIPFTAETVVQLPGRFKNTIRYKDGDRQVVWVQVLDGDRCWSSVNGQVQPADARAADELREAVYRDRVIKLITLRKDAAQFRLTSLGNSEVGNRAAVGVRVESRGHRDVRLYFDKVSGLLLKVEHTALDGGGREVLQEEVVGAYKEFNGVKRPTGVVAYRDGRKSMEAKVTEVKTFDKFPEGEFPRP